MSIPGYATPEGTLNLAEKLKNGFSENAYRTFGRTKLIISKIGFGTYRCLQNNDAHFQALQSAIQNGCNIIDTSANYTDGKSESLISDVMNQEIVWGKSLREEIVLVSKVGYIQGQNMEIAQTKESEQKPFSDVVKYAPGVWHCIHPDFIKDQITRSLSRLHVDVIDVYLLHNPEYFLLNASKNNSTVTDSTIDEFYNRIYHAFMEMENLVEQGLIRFYGISANTFVVPSNRPGFVSLSLIWEVYEKVCAEKKLSVENGHFTVIQFPYNWIEHNAFTLKNNNYQGKSLTILELAKELNLGVMVNRPLNAMRENRIQRLAKYGAKIGINYTDRFKGELQKLVEIENKILELINEENINVQIRNDVDLIKIFQNAETLWKINLQEIDVSQLNELVAYYFIPLFKIGETTILKKIAKEKLERTKAMVEGYFTQFNSTTLVLRDKLDSDNHQKLEPFEKRFDEQNSSLADKLTFSQKALGVVSETLGVNVVLNGMHSPKYVDDSMKIMEVSGINLENLFE
jgi:aryl-alcohol dehydrogenase-like predicted oxidoreductase